MLERSQKTGSKTAEPQLSKLVFPCPFDAETELGRVIAPLVGQLKGLNLSDDYYGRLQAFPLIYAFLKERRLLAPGSTIRSVTLTDTLFLMGNKVGDVLRRPVLSQLLAEAVEREIAPVPAQSQAEAGLRDHMLNFLRLSGYSKFFEGEALTRAMRERFPDAGAYVEMFQDYATWKSLVRDAPLYGYGLAVRANQQAQLFAENAECAAPYFNSEWERRQQAGGSGARFGFYTDPEHMYNQWQITRGLELYAEWQICGCKLRKFPAIERPAHFLLVEDNPFHTAIFDTITDPNFSRVRPPPGMEPGDPALALCELQGYYRSAERALQVIGALRSRGDRAPSLVLADIELGDPHMQMNGLQFVERLWEEQQAAGLKLTIMMVYSSNFVPYETQVERLRARGIVKEAWHKAHFSPEALIAAINKANRE